jgi:hypothetical protein
LPYRTLPRLLAERGDSIEAVLHLPGAGQDIFGISPLQALVIIAYILARFLCEVGGKSGLISGRKAIDAHGIGTVLASQIGIGKA